MILSLTRKKYSRLFCVLPTLNRLSWTVLRTCRGPANRASLNNIALAVVFANRREAEKPRRNPVTAATEPQRSHRGPERRQRIRAVPGADELPPKPPKRI